MNITLEALGFTKEEIEKKLLDILCENILTSTGYDAEDGDYQENSVFLKKIEQKVKECIDNKINEIAEKHIAPKVSEMLQNIVLQETNKWGEKKGVQMTFVEYMISRAEKYLLEKVDYEGRDQEGRYYWKADQTRITNLIHRQLSCGIENAIKETFKTITSTAGQGLLETAKMKLSEIANSLKFEIKTK